MDLNNAVINAFLQGVARQRNMSLKSSGNDAVARFTLAEQLLTANWREELLLAGHCYAQTVGGISAGADVSLVTGGGNGTTIDTDQPELIISVPSGYFLIPLGFRCTVQADLDADVEVANIVLFADTTQAVAATGITGTVAAPKPMLGGGPSGVGYGWHTVTADLTDPVCSILLDYATIMQSQVTAASIANTLLKMDYRPLSPVLLKGPCSVVACWGGTGAVTGMAVLEWAEVPVGRFESQ